MRIRLVQLDPLIGDLERIADSIVDAGRAAADDACDLMITPELSILGYPPRDLLRRRGVVAASERAAADVAERIAAIDAELTITLGHPRLVPGGLRGVRNAVTVWRGGACIVTIDKRLLPGYDVFDEDRYFDAGAEPGPTFDVAGRRVGVVICEDLWRSGDAGASADYDADPVGDQLAAGAEVLVAMHASPFVAGKGRRHADMLQAVADRGVVVASVNQVGTHDDLIFDGRSAVYSPGRPVVGRLRGFVADAASVEIAAGGAVSCLGTSGVGSVGLGAIDTDDPMGELVAAVGHAIHGYVTKSGHERVVLGLSGGIDSALVAALAVAALGPDAVHGLLMPSRYSSDGSVSDAEALATALGMTTDTVPIDGMHGAFEHAGRPTLGDDYEGLPDENVQARIRGLMLMMWSNATGALVLATSNKAELAAGYSTLYGDMCGALMPLGDLGKHAVWDMARWLNAHPAVCRARVAPIPVASIEKPPSAELRPDQRDDDSLPPYAALDRLVAAWVDADGDIAEAAAASGFTSADAQRWTRAIDIAEYKRFQGPVIPKLSPRAFGPGRPMPLLMRWAPGRYGAGM
ncbi:MAG: NAD+ synthase [Phycisphaerales bacterium]